MKIYRIKNFENKFSHKTKLSIAIGNFDGLHRGHQHLLSFVDSCITFASHTKEYFSKQKMQFLLPFREKMIKFYSI